MKMNDAQNIIKGKDIRAGYCVTFEVRKGGMLHSDHFPDVRGGEVGIVTRDEAWALAAEFAHAKHKDEVVNVYVVNAYDFTPVPGYSERMLKRYPPDGR